MAVFLLSFAPGIGEALTTGVLPQRIGFPYMPLAMGDERCTFGSFGSVGAEIITVSKTSLRPVCLYRCECVSGSGSPPPSVSTSIPDTMGVLP